MNTIILSSYNKKYIYLGFTGECINYFIKRNKNRTLKNFNNSVNSKIVLSLCLICQRLSKLKWKYLNASFDN